MSSRPPPANSAEPGSRSCRERSSKKAEIQQLSGTYQSLVEQLESELRSGEVEIEELRGRLQVRALDQILFDSGSAELEPRGREVLAKVAKQLAKVSDRRVRVEGHTDDVPIATARFPSNWELSVGRAATPGRPTTGTPSPPPAPTCPVSPQSRLARHAPGTPTVTRVTPRGPAYDPAPPKWH